MCICFCIHVKGCVGKLGETVQGSNTVIEVRNRQALKVRSSRWSMQRAIDTETRERNRTTPTFFSLLMQNSYRRVEWTEGFWVRVTDRYQEGNYSLTIL